MIKTYHILLLIFSLFLLTEPETFAQKKPFTGTVIYQLSVKGNLSTQNQKLMPKQMVYKYALDKQSMSINFASTEQRTIFDASKKTAKILIDLMGKKVVLSQTEAEVIALRKQEGQTLSVKETPETKTIAGMICKKAILTKKMKDGKEVPSTVYYTEALDISRFRSFNALPDIKGVPLEFTLKKGDMEYTVTAQSIKKETIPASEFVINPQYQEFTVAQLNALFTGKGLGR